MYFLNLITMWITITKNPTKNLKHYYYAIPKNSAKNPYIQKTSVRDYAIFRCFLTPGVLGFFPKKSSDHFKI
jgi:hypothetical protein